MALMASLTLDTQRRPTQRARTAVAVPEAEVLEALLPTHGITLDTKGKVVHRWQNGVFFNAEYVAKRLGDRYPLDEVVAALEAVVDGDRVTATNTHPVGNIPADRHYFFRRHDVWLDEHPEARERWRREPPTFVWDRAVDG